MPQVGEVRTAGGETRQWSGTRWEEFVPPDQSRDEGIFGNIAKTPQAIGALWDMFKPGGTAWSQPGATAKGFASGVSEAATPSKIGGLAALVAPEIGIPAAAIMGGAGSTVADAGKIAFNTANKPNDFGEFMTNAAESAAPPIINGAIGKAVSMVPDAALAVGSRIPGKIGMAARGLRAARGLTGAVGNTASTAVEEPGGFGPRYKTAPQGRTISNPDMSGVASSKYSNEDFWPARETEWAQPPASVKALSMAEPIGAPTEAGAYEGAMSGGRTPYGTLEANSYIDAYPRTTALGEDIGGMTPRDVPESFRESYPPTSEDLTPPKVKGLERPEGFYSNEQLSAMPAEMVPPGEEAAYNGVHAGDVQTPPVTVPELPHGVDGSAEPNPVRDLLDSPSFRGLSGDAAPEPEIEANWGPNATTQAGGKSSLLYDPTTPTSYLQEQLRTTTDPAQRAFLERVLRQRANIDRYYGSKGK